MDGVCYLGENITAVETNQTIIQAAYCAADDFGQCLGICPNPDLSGIGVRVAFYSQSFMNAILIVLSPEDAAAGAWASAVLTGALIIPAIISKLQKNITLHHATLALNYATLSTIASVAAAPMVPIWRRVSKQDDTTHRRKDIMVYKQEVHDRTQGRIVLSLALLAQIILQWTWTVILFVHPYYAQNSCSGGTKIYFIAGRKTANEINHKFFGAWAFWLLICLSGSLVFGVVMVFSCPSPVHDQPIQRRGMRGQRTFIDKLEYYWEYFLEWLLPNDHHFATRWWIRVANITAACIALVFVIISELQIKANLILQGEGSPWTFSQTAAILLAFSPLWPIGIKLLTPKHEPPPILPTTEEPVITGSPSAFTPNALSDRLHPSPLRHPPMSAGSDCDRKRGLYDYGFPDSTMKEEASHFSDIPTLPRGITVTVAAVLEESDESSQDGTLSSTPPNGLDQRRARSTLSGTLTRNDIQQQSESSSYEMGVLAELRTGESKARNRNRSQSTVTFALDRQ